MGVITFDMEKSIMIYLKLGYDKKVDIEDHYQFNRIVMMERNDGTIVELIKSLDERSSVYHFQPGYHHICYELEPGEDLEKCFRKFRIGKVFTAPIIAPALQGRKVVFACLLDKTFIEFILYEESLGKEFMKEKVV